MAALFGLDSSRNVSFFAVPAAFLCAHGPHFYAVVCAGRAYDNADPRAFKDNIANDATLDDKRKRYLTRAKMASENGYETLGLFAAGVVAANQAGVDLQSLNALSWGYVATRVVYNFVYINLGDRRKTSWLRSALWSVSMFLAVGLFMRAGMNAKDTYVWKR